MKDRLRENIMFVNNEHIEGKSISPHEYGATWNVYHEDFVKEIVAENTELREKLKNKNKDIEAHEKEFLESIRRLLIDTVGSFCDDCEEEIADNIDYMGQQFKNKNEWYRTRNHELKNKIEQLNNKHEKSVQLPLNFWVDTTRYQISYSKEYGWVVAYREYTSDEAEQLKKKEDM